MGATEEGSRLREHVACWFFRLNGCFIMTNFIVHPDSRRGNQETDADILSVRFPYRRELQTSGKPIRDHAVFPDSGKIDLVIAEVKKGLCDLNGPWTDSDRQNIHRVLRAIGAFREESEIGEAADGIYGSKYYEDERYVLRLFAIGNRANDSLGENTVQITWDNDILPFIHNRFFTYRDYKRNHHQWDELGRFLFESASENRSFEDFCEIVKSRVGLV